MNQPQLIVFEGVDAAGKSSVCQKYVSALQAKGRKTRLLSFPGKIARTVGELVYRLHADPTSVGVDGLTPTSLQALHIAAHLDVIERVIIPALTAGETIVLDRYWWSTWVYGVVGGVRMDVLNMLIAAERIAWGKWQPSVVFHVTRSSPLREEPAETWKALQSKYAELRQMESGKYPIAVLENEELWMKLSRTHALTRMSSAKVRNAIAQGHFSFEETRRIPLAEEVVDFSFLRPLKPTIVFASYWRFAVERQRVYLRRVRNDPPHGPLILF